MKRLVRAVHRALGWELSRLTDQERRRLARAPALQLRHLAASDALRAEGQIGIGEARFLAELVRGLEGPGPIVEIGTLFGWSTRVLALAKDAGRELISVDNYSWNPLGLPPPLHEETTRGLLAEAAAEHQVRVLAMSAAAFFAGYRGEAPALAFIDGDHAYAAVAADIRGAKAIGARLICGHDYDPVRFAGVARAVDEAGGPRRLVGTLWHLKPARDERAATRSAR
jgi:hypothetical protein